MTNRLNPIASSVSLASQLRGKSRNRRGAQERLALASAAQRRRNDMLPRLELSYVRLEELRPSARKLRKLDPVHVRRSLPRLASLVFAIPFLLVAATSSSTAKRATRRRSN
jgi:hypothetical protein